MLSPLPRVILPALCLLVASGLAAQRLIVKAEIVSVSYRYEGYDPNGKDVSIIVDGFLNNTGNVLSQQNNPFRFHISNGPELHTTQYGPPQLLHYSEIDLRADAFDLCRDTRAITGLFQGWENDSGSDYTFDSGDDDYRAAPYGKEIRTFFNRSVEEVVGAGADDKAYSVRVRYTSQYVGEAPQGRVIGSFTAADEPEPIGKVICEGSTFYAYAGDWPGLRQGRYRYQGRPKGSPYWSELGSGTQPYYRITASGNYPYDRIRIISLQDQDGCGGTGQSVEVDLTNLAILPYYDALANTTYATQATCGGAANGQVTVTPGSDNAPPEMKFRVILVPLSEDPGIVVPGATSTANRGSVTFTGLASGSYRVITTAFLEGENLPEEQCSYEEIVYVGQLAAPYLVPWVTQPLCGQATGEIRIRAFSPDPVEYTVTDANGREWRQRSAAEFVDFIDLPPGNYTAQVTNAQGCSTVKENLVVLPPPAPASGSVRITGTVSGTEAYDLACEGDRALVTFDPQSEHTYSLHLAGYSIPAILPNQTYTLALEAGDYNVAFINEDTKCTARYAFTVRPNPAPLTVAVAATSDPVGCNPTAGSATLTIAGGSAPYTVTNPATASSQAVAGNGGVVSGLTAGVNTLLVRDAEGCSAELTVTLDEPQELAFSLLTSGISCGGRADAVVRAEANSGNLRYRMTLPGGGTLAEGDSLFRDLGPGAYRVTARDIVTNCELTKTVVVEDPGPLRILSYDISQEYCGGDPTLLTFLVSGPLVGRDTLWKAYELSLDGGATYSPLDVDMVWPAWDYFSASSGYRVRVNLNVLPDDYRIRVRSKQDCYSGVLDVQKSEFRPVPPLQADLVSALPPSCAGERDGSITVRYSGGRVPYRVQLYRMTGDRFAPDLVEERLVRDASTTTFSGLAASENTVVAGDGDPTGGYVVLVRDGQEEDTFIECEAFVPGNPYAEGLVPIELTAPAPLVLERVEIVEGDVWPNDRGGGAIRIVATGGTPPYTYGNRYHQGSTSDLLRPAGAQDTAVVYDARGCSARLPYTVTTRETTDFRASTEIIRTANCGNATVRITLGGGFAPYEVRFGKADGSEQSTLLAPADGSYLIRQLTPGDYVYTYRDAHGHSRSANFDNSQSFTVEQPDPVRVSAAAKTAVDCINADNGTLTVNVSGGIAPYEISHRGSVTTGASRTLSGLPPGPVTVVVRDAEGCLDVLRDTIGLRNDIVSFTETSTPVSCYGATDGTLSITPVRGTAPYQLVSAEGTFALAAGESHYRSGRPAGEYEFVLTDASGCSVSEFASVAGPEPIGVAVVPLSQPSCTDPRYTFRLDVSGGTPGYTVTGDAGVTDNGDGTYSVTAANASLTVTDAAGCRYGSSIVVDYRAVDAPVLTATLEAADCAAATRSVRLSASGGSGSYTFATAPDGDYVTDPVFPDLAAGAYDFYVRDANGCTGSLTRFTVPAGSALQASATPTATSCGGAADGGISVTATGTYPPLTYALDGGVAQASGSFGNLAAGVYTVTVRDTAGCSIELPGITVSSAAGFTASVTGKTDPSCNGSADGSATVAGSDPALTYRYRWSDGQTTATAVNLPAGSYVVTVTDPASNCLDIATVVLAEPDALAVDIAVVSPPSCTDDRLVFAVNVSGGTPGYTVTGDAGVTDNGDGTYSVTAANASMTVIDAAGCRYRGALTVPYSAPEQPTVTAEATPVTCAGGEDGTVTATSDPPNDTYAYSLNGTDFQPSPVFTGLSAGVYQVILRSAEGCMATSELVTVQAPSPLTLRFTAAATCGDAPDGAATARAGGGAGAYTYAWSHGETTASVSGLTPGSYQVTVTDAAGCTLTEAVTIESRPVAVVSELSVTDIPCGGAPGAATLHLNLPPEGLRLEGDLRGGSFRLEADGTGSRLFLADLVLGSYALRITTAEGCFTPINFTVASRAPWQAEITAQQPPSCPDATDGSATVAGSDPSLTYTYAWSDGQTGPSATGLAAGTYDVTLTDSGTNCRSVATLTLLAPDPPVLQASVSPSCPGESSGSVTVAVPAGATDLTYRWSTGATTRDLTDVPAGKYTLTVTTPAGCTSRITVIVWEREGFTLRLSDLTDPACGASDGSLAVSGHPTEGDYAFEWSTGARQPEVSGLAAGAYTVTVTDVRTGCTVDSTFVLRQSGSGIPDRPLGDTTLCAGTLYVLDMADRGDVRVAGPQGYSSNAAVSLLETPGEYVVTSVTAGGCAVSETFRLSFTTTPFSAGLVVPSDVVVGDTVVVAEVSWPAPDAVRWVYDTAVVSLLGQEQNRYYFRFDDTGTFDLGLVAGQGGCEDYAAARIHVYADSSEIDRAPLGEQGIRVARVFPNPSSGNFSIEVALSTPQTVLAVLYDLNGMELDRQRAEATSTTTFDYRLNLRPGTYVARLQTPTDQRAVTIVVL